MRGLGYWLSVCVVNLALACAVGGYWRRVRSVRRRPHGLRVRGSAPARPRLPAQHFLLPRAGASRARARASPTSSAGEALPLLANTLTGDLLAGLAVPQPPRFLDTWLPAVLAAVLYQLSFGATFNVYDPFTPDAAVYLLAAVLAMLWWFDRPVMAIGVALVGVFAKEAVALVISTMALATLNRHTASRRAAWIVAAAAAWIVLLGFHAVMDVFFGWTESDSASANVLNGGFLRRWLADPTLTPS